MEVELAPVGKGETDPGGVLRRALDKFMSAHQSGEGMPDCLHIQTIDGRHACISGDDPDA